MNPEMSKHIIINNDELDKYVKNGNLLDYDKLENNKYLIEINKKSTIDNFKNRVNISVPIAAAITAYSRIYMSEFKNNPNFTLYYSDTDSIDINKKLDSKYISGDIGKFKLQDIFKEVVYLAPKVYGYINKEDKIEILIKGYKSKLMQDFNKFKSLLKKDEYHKINQNKLYKDYGWVKKDGKWLKPLKFLGLIYEGVDKRLFGGSEPWIIVAVLVVYCHRELDLRVPSPFFSAVSALLLLRPP